MTCMGRWLLLLCAMCSAMTSASGGDAKALDRAGDLRQSYDRLSAECATGEPAASDLFNLGVCAFRLDRPAEASWLWRRARLRQPRDPQIAAAIAEVDQRLAVSERSRGMDGGVVAAIERWSVVEVAFIAVALQIVGLIGVARGRRGVKRVAFGLLAALGILLAVGRAWRLDCPMPIEAVVLDAPAAMHGAPHRDDPSIASLTPGEVVTVRERSDRWVRVTRGVDQGWVMSDALGIVE